MQIHDSIHDEIDFEFDRAYKKHHGRTPRSRQVSDGESLAILVEEVGEVARAMTYDEGDVNQLATELIQVATMAAAWAERLLRGGDHPFTTEAALTSAKQVPLADWEKELLAPWERERERQEAYAARLAEQFENAKPDPNAEKRRVHITKADPRTPPVRLERAA